MRKHTFNTNFFSKPNLLNSYWAGFIAADGCIYIDPYNRCSLEIHLQKKDEKHLKKFIKDINYSGNLDELKARNACRVRLRGVRQTLYKDLNKNFNITPRKSSTLKFPKKLTKQQKIAYIVGYIDGDGCTGYYKNGNKFYFVLNILGTRGHLRNINLIFNRITKCNFNRVHLRSKKLYHLSYMGRKALKIYEFLKEVNVPKLERKWCW